MKNKTIVVLGVVISIGICVGAIIYSNNKEIKQETTNELPLNVKELEVDMNIVNEKNEIFIESDYINNSEYDISRLDLELKLKNTDEVVEININENVEIGATSQKVRGVIPNNTKLEDVEVIKYKISLKKGVYMEYDVKSKSYNWS